MAKEVQIITWCDAEGEKHRADGQWTISINQFLQRSIDLCEVHAKELVEPLETLVRQHGVIPEDTRPMSGKKSQPAGVLRTDPEANPPCPVCGFQSVNRGSLQNHVKRMHGMTLMQAGIPRLPNGWHARKTADDAVPTDETPDEINEEEESDSFV